MTGVRHNGSPAVCPDGTQHGTDAGIPAVACRVQNQSQIQTVVSVVCGVCSLSRIASLRSVSGSTLTTARPEAVTMRCL